MCRSLLLPAFLLLSLAVPSAGAGSEPPDVEGELRLRRLAAELGHRDFDVRERATRTLFEMGEAALPRLRVTARTATRLEVRRRAGRLVPRIMRIACSSRSTSIRLSLLDAGRFEMGSPKKESGRREDERLHTVEISRPILVATHEVTQADFRTVMGEAHRNWFSKAGKGGPELKAFGDTDRFPVDSVTWFDAIAFCNELSRLDGLEPYYALRIDERKNGSITGGLVRIAGGTGYRLPTEAEWEYACRAGTDKSYQFGTGKSRPAGNFQYFVSTGYGSPSKAKSLGRTTTVGSYSPNPWGLYDMHGNVAEWCWDWYDKQYPQQEIAVNPSGPGRGDHRVLRGGSWLVKQSSCRCATRFWCVPVDGPFFTGFRIARDPSDDMIENR